MRAAKGGPKFLFRVARSTFEQLPLARIEVVTSARSGGGAEAERHVFDPSTALDWQPQRQVEGYRLRVALAQGESLLAESHEVELPRDPESIDILLMVFDARALPWSTMRAVEVRYTDLAGTPQGFRLTAKQPLWPVFAGIDFQAGRPFDYSLEFLVLEGNFIAPHRQSDQLLIPVEDPFVVKSVTFEAVGVEGADPSVQVVQVAYRGKEQGPGWRLEGSDGSAQLSAGNSSKEISYRIVHPTRALTSYSGTVIYKSGHQQPIPKAEISPDRILVGATDVWWTVTIDPSQIDWTRFQLVIVQLAQDDPTREPQGLRAFLRGWPSQAWSFPIQAEESGVTAWRAWFVSGFDQHEQTTWTITRSHRLVLPAAPPGDYDETRTD